MDFENDPAAEFLQREREELADIIHDNESEFKIKRNSKQKFNESSIRKVPAVTSQFDQLMSDEFELVNNEIQQAADSMANEFSDDLSGMSFISSQPKAQEPEKIKLWRENMQRQLEEKDNTEAEAKEALRINAQKEMEDWVKKYNEQLQKTKSFNRTADEDLKHSDLNGNSEGKNVWEQISSLCDFSSKGPKSTKDASRIRQIFLQMKTSSQTKVI